MCYFLSFIISKINPTQNSTGTFKISGYKYIPKKLSPPKLNKKLHTYVRTSLRRDIITYNQGMIKKTKYSWIVTNITTHAKNRKYGIYVPKQYKGILLKCKNYKCSLWEYRSIHHVKTWNIDDIWIKIQQFFTYC